MLLPRQVLQQTASTDKGLAAVECRVTDGAAALSDPIMRRRLQAAHDEREQKDDENSPGRRRASG